MREYFDMLGVELEPVFRIDPQASSGPQLRTLTSLKQLRLHFRAIDDGTSGSPFFQNMTWSNDTPYICCQRTMVDWICTILWPFLAGRTLKGDRRKVGLTGAVKLPTKQKWENIWHGKVAYGPQAHQAAMAAIFSNPQLVL